MSEIQTNLPCILLLLALLAGLSFMALNDHYILRIHKRIMLIIAALDFSLVLQNLVSFYLEVELCRPMLRTVISIYGYAVRPLILIMFFYLAIQNKDTNLRGVSLPSIRFNFYHSGVV